MTNANKRLIAVLAKIPDGQVSETARRAGMSPSQMRGYRSGATTDPRLSTLERLSKALGISLCRLLDDLQPEPPAPVQQSTDAKALRSLARVVRQLRSGLVAAEAALKEHG